MDNMFKDFIGEICEVRILDGPRTSAFIGRVDGISPNNQVALSHVYYRGQRNGWQDLEEKVRKLWNDGHSESLDKQIGKYAWPRMLLFSPVTITPVGRFYKDALFNDEAFARFFDTAG